MARFRIQSGGSLIFLKKGGPGAYVHHRDPGRISDREEVIFSKKYFNVRILESKFLRFVKKINFTLIYII